MWRAQLSHSSRAQQLLTHSAAAAAAAVQALTTCKTAVRAAHQWCGGAPAGRTPRSPRPVCAYTEGLPRDPEHRNKGSTSQGEAALLEGQVQPDTAMHRATELSSGANKQAKLSIPSAGRR